MTKTVDKIALVDDEDLHLFVDYSWYVAHGYISRQLNYGGGQYQQRLHREILGLKPYDGKEVDHINGNKLDNRRENLRICSRQHNIMNRSKFRTNKSGYKGVSYKDSNSRFVSQIQLDGRVVHIGMFNDAENAAYVYDQFATVLHGEYARLNLL